jgi:hypothetical protein
MTLDALFVGNMGRVELTRVAIRLRMPTLLKMRPGETLSPDLCAVLQQALLDIRRG